MIIFNVPINQHFFFWLYNYLYYLLQECNQAACPPLVRFGQAYVFQVENQVLTVFGSEDATCVRTEQQAGLAELLQDMSRRSLGTAVNHSNLCGTKLRQGMAEQHAEQKTRRKTV